MIKGVLLDLSGTVYLDDALLPGAARAIERVRAKGFPLRYITNTSRRSRRTMVERLQAMGLAIAEEEVFTATRAVREYLLEHRFTPWLLVHPEVEEEFADLVGPEPEVVVLGDAADAFSYASLNAAFRLLLDGARLLAVGDNRYFREKDGMSLDAGPFVAALEYATGRQAIVLGKPSPAFFHAVAGELGCRPREILMVGDDVYSDVNGALKAGMKAALVRTGKYRPGDEEQICAPGACVCADLAEALEGLGRSDC